MKHYDVQGIDLEVSREKAFAFIADPAQLPRWTSAFESVANGKAVMRPPQGRIEVGLAVETAEEAGTVDWRMTFPEGQVATAFSRVIALDPKRCAYLFVLTPPPVPLEQLEGALDAQSRTLAEELKKLKGILEAHD